PFPLQSSGYTSTGSYARFHRCAPRRSEARTVRGSGTADIALRHANGISPPRTRGTACAASPSEGRRLPPGSQETLEKVQERFCQGPSWMEYSIIQPAIRTRKNYGRCAALARRWPASRTGPVPVGGFRAPSINSFNTTALLYSSFFDAYTSVTRVPGASASYRRSNAAIASGFASS